MTTALLIIDIQNDYFPGGVFELDNPQAAANKAQQLLGHFRETNQPVIHIQHENLVPELPLMKPDSWGQQIHQSVTPKEGEAVVIKHFPSSFWDTHLEELLRGQSIDKVLIVGMMTHMCVSTTARAAMERGFQVAVVADACATRALEFQGKTIPAKTVHQTALAELAMIAELITSNDFLTQVA